MGLRVIAHFTPKSGKEDQLKSALTALIEPTRQEKGCITYELHKNTEKPEYTFIEEWTSEDALAEHFETNHIKTALVAFEALADSFDVRKYELIS